MTDQEWLAKVQAYWGAILKSQDPSRAPIVRTVTRTSYSSGDVVRYSVREVYTRREVLFEQQDDLNKLRAHVREAKRLLEKLPVMILSSAVEAIDGLADDMDDVVSKVEACADAFEVEIDHLAATSDCDDAADDLARGARYAADKAAYDDAKAAIREGV